MSARRADSLRALREYCEATLLENPLPVFAPALAPCRALPNPVLGDGLELACAMGGRVEFDALLNLYRAG